MSGHGRRGRGGGHAGGGGHGGWLVTYADLLTLLMVVFLVLWVISQIDLAKFEKFKEGLGDFGNPAAEGESSGGTPAESTTTTLAPPGEGTMTADGQLTGAGLNQLAATVQEAISLSGLDDLVSVEQTDQGLVLTLSTDDILFESGSAAILPAGADVLGVLTPALNGFNNRILVTGHTDKRPLKTAGYDNWDLSVDRAVTVVKLLRDRFGLAPDRLSASGFGDTKPIAEGDDPASLAKNRRVEIVVVASAPVPEPAAEDATGTTGAAEPAGELTPDGAPADTVVAEAPAETQPTEVTSDTEPVELGG